ncbi:MAG: T9SS type A sorting domain-containing protein [Bacteroidales bacterium]|nr:T9SS type A sorting domain-containing protein [Bacteroidales bacterium]MCF8405492.1 T9SS type A sorting domain-containing protein [Bacteroidales bacterium]
MKRYIVQWILIFLVSSAFGQTKVSRYEYWFDSDYLNKTQVSVALTDQFTLSEMIPTSGLDHGVHTYNIRFQDDAGQWSTVLSQFFYKIPATSPVDRKLSKYEYWFDGDYTNKIESAFSPTDNLNLSALIPSAGLTEGVHTYNIRFRDDTGLWSSIMSQFFYKIPASSQIDRKLTEYEYWFDGDYANKQIAALSPADQLNLNTLISTGDLNDGVHVYNIRFKDNSGFWSSTLSQFFYKIPQNTSINNKVTTYRYWLDDDFAGAITQNFTIPAQNITLIDNIDLSKIAKGLHNLNFQFKDSLGMWSSVMTDEFEKLSLPVSGFTYSSVSACDSTVYSFVDKSIDGDVYHWDFGDGDSDTVANPVHNYYVPGNYIVSLSIKDTLTSLESTKQEIISVKGSTQSSISVTECDSYTSPSGLNIWTSSGIYTDVIPNSMACDSIITIDLTITQSTSGSITESACDNYEAPDGKVYTTSGIITAVIPNLAGCDSIITIDLTINTVDVSVNQTGNSLIANADPASYQWLDCNSGYSFVPDETGRTFDPEANGNYAVLVTQNGCVDTSECTTLTTVNILENTFESDINVYPNPTSGRILIDLGASFEKTIASLSDMNGKIVKQFTFNNNQKMEVNIEQPAGIYFLTLRSGNNTAIIRIIKY